MAEVSSAFAKFKSDFAANGDVNSLQQQLMALKVLKLFSPIFFLKTWCSSGLRNTGSCRLATQRAAQWRPVSWNTRRFWQ